MDRKIADAKFRFGMTRNIFAVSNRNGETIIVGGLDHQSRRWSRLLTRRAAHMMWFHLTTLLFPSKCSQVISMAQTAPLGPVQMHRLTTFLSLTRRADTHLIEIFGQVGEDTWSCFLDDLNAQRLWASLDAMLYPAGWEGTSIIRRKIN